MTHRDDHQRIPATPLTWLVTGASQGFGRALIAEVLSRGEAVVASVRDANSVQDLKDRYAGMLTVVTADLRDPGSVERVAAAGVERFGTPDVLVNNAGRAIVGAAEELSMAELRDVMELNFFAAAELTRAILPGMRQRGGGTVIQLSSQGGRLSFPGIGAYSASKFALKGWSEALAADVSAAVRRPTRSDSDRLQSESARRRLCRPGDVRQ